MQNKLQELTDKLYREGLSKGKAAGEALLAEAGQQADRLVEDARREAEQIKAQARREAEDFRTKVESDLKMAAAQALQATRQDLERLVVCRLTDTEVSDALGSAEFIRGILTEVARRFSAEECTDLRLVLPETLQKELEPFVRDGLGRLLHTGVTATFSKKIAGGFTIGPKDGSYYISLTDETFRSLISEYLRPATRKLLYGE